MKYQFTVIGGDFGQGFLGVALGKVALAGLPSFLDAPLAVALAHRDERHIPGHPAAGPGGSGQPGLESGQMIREWRHDRQRSARLLCSAPLPVMEIMGFPRRMR
jgi:hypothetical protein